MLINPAPRIYTGLQNEWQAAEQNPDIQVLKSLQFFKDLIQSFFFFNYFDHTSVLLKLRPCF